MTSISLGKEFWVGLQNIYALTNRLDNPMQLRVSMEKFSNETATAYYDTFSLEDKVWFKNMLGIIYKSIYVVW